MPLDPAIASLLAAGRDLPPTESLTPEAARAAIRERIAPLLALAPAPPQVTDFSIAGPGGDLPVRLLRPATPGPHPVVVFCHGGGWVLCDLDTHQPQAAALCAGSGAAVLMVDYRLAPEHRFPAAVDDCWAALAWAHWQGAGHGLDPLRMAVAGDSAGGNLAAVLARKARDAGGPHLAGQYLIYPVTDLPDPFTYPSYVENAGFGLTLESMAWYWSQYAGRARPDEDAVPMRVEDLAGLCPALVQTAECDVLRDEGEAYAARLAAAGVSVSLARHAGMNHGFLALAPLVPGAAAALAQGAAWLAARLAPA